MAVSQSDALHLFRRTGLSIPLQSTGPLLSMSRAELVDWVLDVGQNPTVGFAPAGRDWQSTQSVKAWWVDRMASVPRPFEERLVLFWHNHFTSANRKVSDAVLMWNQNQLFRSLGSGDFSELAKAASIDPAMLVWLDGGYSTKWGPNENFSRELLELFLLGVNNGYSEFDVREMARAWTGHTFVRDANDEVIGHELKANRHDSTSKTLFGVTAPWEGTQVLDAMIVSGGQLEHMRPVVARHLSKKLWLWFAGTTPNPELHARLAAMLGSTPRMNIGSFLRSMFNLDDFYAPEVKAGLVRDPLLWIATMLRTSGLNFNTAHVDWYLDQLSMVPLDPPNVAGWKPNRSWISASAFWKRAETAWTMFDTARKAAPAGVNFLGDVTALSATAVVSKALDVFGEDRISDGSTTWSALVALVEADRADNSSSWAVVSNLARAIAISPEYSMA